MQMAATGAEALTSWCSASTARRPRSRCFRDDELIAALENLGATFWQRVQGAIPRRSTAAGARHWLNRQPWSDTEYRADSSQADALERLLAIRAQVKALEAEDADLVNALAFTMAGASRLYAPGVGRVLWTAPTTKRTVRWKEVAAAYRATPRHPGPVDLNRSRDPPYSQHSASDAGPHVVRRAAAGGAGTRSPCPQQIPSLCPTCDGRGYVTPAVADKKETAP